jgi:hypothetical protein
VSLLTQHSNTQYAPYHCDLDKQHNPTLAQCKQALGRQRAPSIQARARLWSPGLPAAVPAGAAGPALGGDKAGQALVPAQKENLNPQASPVQSIGSFPGASGMLLRQAVCVA